MGSIVDIFVMGFIFVFIMVISWCLFKFLFLISDSRGNYPTFHERYIDNEK